MKPFTRSERVGGLIMKNLAEILQKDISDPRLARAIITGVKVTADLRIANIYFFSPVPEGKSPKDALDGFQSANKFIKRELAQRLGLRYMPDLKYFYDESIEYGANIERLLNSVKQNHETDH